MKATELRIGNYYRYLHEESESIHKVDVDFLKIQHAYDIDPDADEFARGWWSAPIPIDEQWLLDFGFKYRNECRGEGAILDFKKSSKDKDWKLGLSIAFEYEKNGGGIFLLGGFGRYHYNFVHQLQNLYFSLTGTELTINQP